MFYHLQSVSILHIPSKPLNLIDLSHITMKTSLNITRTHTHPLMTGFYWVFVKKTNQQILLDFRSGVTGFSYLVLQSHVYLLVLGFCRKNPWILGRGSLGFTSQCKTVTTISTLVIQLQSSSIVTKWKSNVNHIQINSYASVSIDHTDIIHHNGRPLMNHKSTYQNLTTTTPT